MIAHQFIRVSPKVVQALVLFVALMGAAVLFDAVWAESKSADAVFSQSQQHVVQIRIVEASSGVKATVGSGFIVSPQGHIVTNYHVISQLVHKPKLYRGEIIHHDEYTSPLTLVSFDAIHDLALVQTDRPSDSHFRFHMQEIEKGVRVYALGNPWDLGTTIVEGTHSGLLEHSLYEKIHFTGSLNPGMSGGPAVSADGRVVGVNVSSAGNQLSFLVPAKFAQKLVTQAISEPPPKPEAWLMTLRDQLLQHQDQYLGEVLSQEWSTTSLGPYQVPGEIASFVKCWGDSAQREKQLYVTVTQTCSFEDGIFLSQSQTSGTLQFTHTYMSSDQLNQFRFYNLYQQNFQGNFEEYISQWFDDEEEVAPFRCVDDFVAQDGPAMKVVMCVRGYKKLPGLYDSTLKIATIDQNQKGLQATIMLTGVSFENAQSFSRKFLASIESSS